MNADYWVPFDVSVSPETVAAILSKVLVAKGYVVNEKAMNHNGYLCAAYVLKQGRKVVASVDASTNYRGKWVHIVCKNVDVRSEF